MKSSNWNTSAGMAFGLGLIIGIGIMRNISQRQYDALTKQWALSVKSNCDHVEKLIEQNIELKEELERYVEKISKEEA
jgi:predicted solute-binding protein